MSEKDANKEETLRALKTIAKGGAISFAGVIFSKLTGFFYLWFSAKLLGPGTYGVLVLAITVFTFLTIIASLGLSHATQYFVSKYRSKKQYDKLRGAVKFTGKLLFAISIFIALTLFVFSEYVAKVLSPHNSQMLAAMLRIFAALLPAATFATFFYDIFIGVKRIEYLAAASYFCENTVKVGAAVVFAVLGLGVFGLAFAYALSVVASFLLAAWLFETRVWKGIKAGNSVKIPQGLLSYGWPVSISTLVGAFMIYVPTLALGIFLDSTAVGLYNVAFTIATLLTLIPSTLYVLLLPNTTEFLSKNMRKEAERIFKITNRWVTALALPIYLPMLLFPAAIIRFVYGIEYEGGATALALIASAYMFAILIGPAAMMLLSAGRPKLVLANTLAGATITGLASYFFIPIYGATGAGLAMLLGYVTANTILAAGVWKALYMHPYEERYIRTFLACIISVTIIYGILKLLFTYTPYWVLVPAFIAFITLNGTLMLIFHAFSEEDVELIEAVERKTGIPLSWLRELMRRSG
jgi:O-antigen/teichoic acid export membrane protein